MNIVVVGYGEMFDALVAGIIESGHSIVGIFRHERTIHNGLGCIIKDTFRPTANRLFSKALKLYDIKAKSVNSDKFREEIKKLNTDIIIVGSWGERFSQDTINAPNIACVNVHPSLLPKYRGPNPYTQTILHDEKISGITFHIMDNNYDTGKILLRCETSISQEETGLSLKLKCCHLARKEVGKLLNSFDDLYKNVVVQDEDQASYYHRISIGASILYFEKETSEDISRRIRALSPWLMCHIPYKSEFFEFQSYQVTDEYSEREPATIIKKTDSDLFIVCKDYRVIKFSKVKLKRPSLRIFTKFYLKKFVNINSRAI